MCDQNNHKKEIFLYLVLIHLNLKPAHRIHLIVQSNFVIKNILGIKKCLEYSNSAMAEALFISLKPNLDKNAPLEDDLLSMKDCEDKLKKIEEK